MQTPTPKTGFLSSEFYLTLAQSITGIFVILGYLTPKQADDFIKAVVSVIGGLMIIVPTVVYLVGRVALKKDAIENGTSAPKLPDGGMLGDAPKEVTPPDNTAVTP